MYLTPPFRDPSLYGVPVFSIGIDDRITYEGQYLYHRVRNVTEGGYKNRTYWVITTGFATIYARNRETELIIPVIVNGVVCPTVSEVIRDSEVYDFIEDVKPVREVEVPYSSLLNLDEVTSKKAPALIIDPHGLLSNIPRDVLKKYYDLMSVNKSLQSVVYELSGRVHELMHQIELYRSEHSVLIGLFEEISTKFTMTIAAMRELKVRLLEAKDRQHYLEKVLKTTTANKEKWEILSSELMEMGSKFSKIVSDLDEHLQKIESVLQKVEGQKLRLSSLESMFSEKEGEEEEGGGESED